MKNELKTSEWICIRQRIRGSTINIATSSYISITFRITSRWWL